MSSEYDGIMTRGGCMISAGLAWILGAGLLSAFARLSAIIPSNEPVHSQGIAEANAIAFRIFIFAATPGFVLLIWTIWKGLRKS